MQAAELTQASAALRQAESTEYLSTVPCLLHPRIEPIGDRLGGGGEGDGCRGPPCELSHHGLVRVMSTECPWLAPSTAYYLLLRSICCAAHRTSVVSDGKWYCISGDDSDSALPASLVPQTLSDSHDTMMV